MKKSDRIKIWEKYGKHCSYCGKKIEYKDMQVDHLIPIRSLRKPSRYKEGRWKKDSKECIDFNQKVTGFDNLMPSCRRCNHYKRALPLKDFRRLLVTLHDRIKEMYMSKVAVDYGIIDPVPWSGVFYFENLNNKEQKAP